MKFRYFVLLMFLATCQIIYGQNRSLYLSTSGGPKWTNNYINQPCENCNVYPYGKSKLSYSLGVYFGYEILKNTFIEVGILSNHYSENYKLYYDITRPAIMGKLTSFSLLQISINLKSRIQLFDSRFSIIPNIGCLIPVNHLSWFNKNSVQGTGKNQYNESFTYAISTSFSNRFLLSMGLGVEYKLNGRMALNIDFIYTAGVKNNIMESRVQSISNTSKYTGTGYISTNGNGPYVNFGIKLFIRKQ